MSDRPDVMLREWLEALWNQGREETIDRMLSVDAPVHGLPRPRAEPMKGPAEFRPFFESFTTALSDMHMQVLRTVTENDMVVAYCRVTGHYTANLLGVEAKGQAIDFTGFTMARIQNGRVVEGWNCYDCATFYRQLGVAIP